MRQSLTLILFLAMIAGCTSVVPDTGSGQQQGVRGIVWLRPGYDGEDARYIMHPPDTTPIPLEGAFVYLLTYHADRINSKDIISSTRTDSLGRFSLPARPGMYNLAVWASGICAPVRRFSPDDTVGLDFPINAVSTIEVKADTIIEHSFNIAELSTQ